MSYPIGLDEYEEAVLFDEIGRRKAWRVSGRCDYCGRSPDALACKFPKRHRAGTPAPQEGTS